MMVHDVMDLQIEELNREVDSCKSREVANDKQPASPREPKEHGTVVPERDPRVVSRK